MQLFFCLDLIHYDEICVTVFNGSFPKARREVSKFENYFRLKSKLSPAWVKSLKCCPVRTVKVMGEAFNQKIEEKKTGSTDQATVCCVGGRRVSAGLLSPGSLRHVENPERIVDSSQWSRK